MAQSNQITSTDDPTNQSWRGPGTKVIRHRWQKDWTQQPLRRLQVLSQWRKLRLIILLILFVGLIALLLDQLLYSPTQTPMLTIGVTDYRFPLAPNSWTQEDIEHFGEIASGKKNSGSIRLTNASGAWDSKAAGLAELERQIIALGKTSSRSGVVVIYLSMHGAVNAQGQPCLIPPNRSSAESALDSKNWIPLVDLLDMLRANLPEKLNKLLVLDCNRMKVNWRIGMLNNTFAQRLPKLIQQAKIPNLAVINSTRDEQIGFSSPDLKGSVFAHYLKLGLAGFADDEAGNGDSSVSLQELEKYLEHHVDHWAVFNRAFHQQPMLIRSSEGSDFHLAYSLKESAKNKLVKRYRRTKPPIAAYRLDNFWEKIHQYKTSQPLQLDPIAWTHLQQQLLWLEQVAVSGKAYSSTLRTTYKQIKDFRDAIDAQLKKNGQHSTIANDWQLFSRNVVPLQSDLQLHSTMLAEQLGLISAEQAAMLQEKISAVKENASSENINAAIAAFDSLNLAQRLDDHQFLMMLVDQKNPQIGRPSTAIAQALELRQRAAQLAAPQDLRVLPWIEKPLIAANYDRLAAEDFLMSGSADQLAGAKQYADKASKLFDTVEKRISHISKSLKIRDRALADLPYYARWVSRPLSFEIGPTKRKQLDQQVNEILDLIQKTDGLDEMLQKLPVASSSDTTAAVLQIVSQADEIETSITKFNKALKDDVKAILKLKRDSGFGPRIGYEIEEILASPIVAKQQRADLRQLLGDFQQGRYGRFKDIPVGTEVPKKKPAKEKSAKTKSTDKNKKEPPKGKIIPFTPISYQQRMLTRWTQSTQHPALALLSDDAQQNMNAKQDNKDQQTQQLPLLTQGENVRQLLSSTLSQAQAVRQSTEATESRVGQFVRADQMVRRAISFYLPATSENPAVELRKMNLQQLLLAHARSEIRDFTGPAARNETDFWQVAAENYLDEAARVFDGNIDFPKQRNSLQNWIDSTIDVAEYGLVPQAENVVLLSPTELISLKMVVKSEFQKDHQNRFPKGFATVSIRDSKGMLPGTARQLKLPLSKDDRGRYVHELIYKLPGESLIDRDSILYATTSFRGHTYETPFLLRANRGLKVEFNPIVYGPPEIKLSGPRKRRASVVVILDCSQSMKQMVKLESPTENEKDGKPGRNAQRLDIAKMATLKILEQFANQRDVDVGLRLFGHRAGWNRLKAGERLLRRTYGRKIPDYLDPGEDVEVIRTIGRFDPHMVADVAKLLKTVKPWGESPIHLSIIQSLQELGDQGAGRDKIVIVITDGKNEQTNAQLNKTADDVVAALKKQKAQVHIIDFGIPDDEAKEARRDFEKITKASGGEFRSAKSATQLIQHISAALGSSKYKVTSNDGFPMGETELNRPVKFKQLLKQRTPFQVAFGKLAATIELADGENAQLSISRDGKRIESMPYLVGNPRFGRLVRGDNRDSTGYQLGVHRPVILNDGVRFTVSLQHLQNKYPIRPQEVWLEIIPLASELQAEELRYLFYDPQFKPAMSVPVLSWKAEGWPKTAQKAQIRFWCKPAGEHSKSVSIKLASMLNQLPKNQVGWTRSEFSGVRFQVKGRAAKENGKPTYQLAVIQQHPKKGEFQPLKVELSLKADTVIRRFDAKLKVATHTFYFSNVDEKTISQKTMKLTSRQSAHQDAWRLDDPMIIDISSTDDVIQPSLK